MLLTYRLENNKHSVYIRWTADTGHSTVFRDIVRQVDDRHQFCLSHYHEMATHIDELVDKLYEQLYIFTNEYSGVPYNPQMRRTILGAYRNIRIGIREFKRQTDCEYVSLLAGLFVPVLKKLRKTARIYLEDHAYQAKFHRRQRDKEQYVETTPEIQMAVEFEYMHLQMMDIAHQLDCLTEKERQRLVKHTFLSHTMQEIADSERTTKQAVQQSISSALIKLREHLS